MLHSHAPTPRLRICAGIAIALLSANCWAVSDEVREQQFRAADQDQSRGLSRAEVETSYPGPLLRHFSTIDENQDGELTPEELRAAQALEAQKRDARRARRLEELQGK